MVAVADAKLKSGEFDLDHEKYEKEGEVYRADDLFAINRIRDALNPKTLYTTIDGPVKDTVDQKTQDALFAESKRMQNFVLAERKFKLTCRLGVMAGIIQAWSEGCGS